MTDYSQNGEGSVILEYVGDKPGRFCDVGAYDAFALSNTRGLFERGWGGVLVEPNPLHAARLREQYADAPEVVVIEAAMALFPGTVEMRMTDDATSTAHPDTHAKWQQDVAYWPGTHTVPAVAWGDVWRQHGPFDVVSIDAEGWSMPLLGRLLVLGHQPRVIVVEHDGQVVNAAILGGQAGYSVALRNAENVVLVLGKTYSWPPR